MTERTRYISEEGPIRVLHVDDDACFLKTAKAILEMQGTIRVDTASCVEEAVGKMKTEKYDVIVCDYQMPRKDGLQFLKELREKRDSIPFIIFTGKGREEVAIKALNLGADGYFSKSGDPETIYGELAHGMRQVVDKRRAEQSFLKSEDKYRRLVETLHEGIWAIDKESYTTFVNPRMAEILGYNIEEMKGRHLFSFMDERGVEIAKRFLERRKQGIKEQHDFEFLRKDGTRVYVTLETAPITDDNGNYIGALASVMDITEHKKAKVALQESEERFRAIVENAPFGYYRVGKNGLWQYVNPMWERMHRLSLEEVVGKAFEITQTEDSVEQAKEYVKRALAGETISGEFSRLTGEGDVEYHSFNIQPVKRNNEIVAIEGFINDITGRKKAEEALVAERDRLEIVTESIGAGLAVISEDYCVLWANRVLRRMFGDVEGKICYSAYHERSEICPGCGVREVFEKGKDRVVHERVGKDVDGKIIWTEIISTPIKDKSGKVIAAAELGVSVTERKKAEGEIGRSERKYRSLVEQSVQGIAVVQGPAVHLVFVNAAMSRILGYTREELTSLSPQETTGLIHPEDQGVFFGRFKDRLEGKTAPAHYEFRGVRKDGTVVWLEQSAAIIEYNGQPAVQATFVDVTERKEALEGLRVLNEKLGVVGKLTRHDVRNKLSSVINNVYLAKQSLPEDPKALAYLRDIELACEQTTRILDFAAAYESLGVEELTLIDVGKAVEEAVSLTPNLKGIKVMNECHGITVIADSLLRQLFYNLIDNSLKHGEKVSQIRFHHEEGKDGLELFYEDDGVGIPKAVKSKILDSAFTAGKGSGYGLPLIKRMMEVYGWQIGEKGEPGKGAKFVITIPMHADSNQKQRHSNKKAFY